MNPKQRAAQAALAYVRSDTVIGLGTGSTAEYFLVALADALFGIVLYFQLRRLVRRGKGSDGD